MGHCLGVGIDPDAEALIGNTCALAEHVRERLLVYRALAVSIALFMAQFFSAVLRLSCPVFSGPDATPPPPHMPQLLPVALHSSVRIGTQVGATIVRAASGLEGLTIRIPAVRPSLALTTGLFRAEAQMGTRCPRVSATPDAARSRCRT